MARPPAIETDTALWLALNTRSAGLTDDQFYLLCRDNADFRFEMSAQGDLIIMSPNFPDSDQKNTRVIQRLANWTEQDGTGICFGCSAMFTLPNGAKRAPDAAWIASSRWYGLTQEERMRFSRICPDFVVELRSPSDRLSKLKEKLEEYIANGARLGWLLDPLDNRAYIYRPAQPVEEIGDPKIISGEPVLPGFRLNFKEIV